MVIHIHKSKSDWLKLRKQILKSIYGDDPHFRDSTTPLLKMLLAPAGCFANDVEIFPCTVSNSQGNPLAIALLIIARKMPNILQVGFFEALPGQLAAVKLLMTQAKETAKNKDIRKIVIGLNGHVNNGLGFVATIHSSAACFGSAYNPSYYIDYLSQTAAPAATLVSYSYDLSDMNIVRWEKVIGRVSRRFKVRQGNFNNMRQEIALYTQLNNACFKNHPLYYERSAEEDFELFKSFGPFLKEENFLVSEFEGKPIGFLLWYPDFHELIPPGKTMGLGTALKYRFPGNPIAKFKIAEIGILPEYQGSAAIAGLIRSCLDLCKKNGHSLCESGWIFDSNAKSRGVSERWIGQRHNTYKVFEIDV